jgi:hypothetical protein
VGEAAVAVVEAGVAMTTDRVAVEVVGSIEVAMIEVTEVVMRTDEVVMTMEDIGEAEVTTEEAMEADMKIEEIETIQAATLILADAIEEIQTGDLLLKMILERPPQRRQRPDLSLNCYRER